MSLPPMEQLSLLPQHTPSWNGMPQELRTAIRDVLKTQEGGCHEARRQCANPVDKEHLAWCTENRTYLRTCDLMEVRLDASKLTYPHDRYDSAASRERRMARDREVIQSYGGVLMVPTTQWGALNRRLLSFDEVSVMQLTRTNLSSFSRGREGSWYTSVMAPDYVFWMRTFNIYVRDLINDQHVDESQYMVYAVKRELVF